VTNAPSRNSGLLLIAGLGCALVFLLLFACLAFAVDQGSGPGFDVRVRSVVHEHATPARTEAMRFITAFGAGPVLMLGWLLATFGLILGGRKHAAVLLAATLGGALLLDGTLKMMFHRARPEPFFGYPLPQSYGFPSGHALFSVCLYGVLAVLAARRARNPLVKWAVLVSGGVVVILIGLSRVYLGVHYPSDVIAGYCAGIVWVTTVALADAVRLRRRRSG
jgi:membrane-associated phospholipid phosphatase